MSSIEIVAKLFTEGKITQEEFLQLIKDLSEKTQVVIEKKDPNEGSPTSVPFTYPFTPSIPGPYTSPGDQPWRYPIVTYATPIKGQATCGKGFGWIVHSTL